MATKKTASKSSSSKPRALALLIEDHETVAGYFKKYERSEDDEEKTELIAQMCAALQVHAQIEEEIFYPALREALGDKGQDTLAEANVEHEHVKSLVEQLDGAEAGDEMVDARVKVLTEYVKHHVKEEEGEMFTMAKKVRELDLDELGERMEERKTELEAEVNPPSESPRRKA